MQYLRTFCLLMVLSAAVGAFAQAGGAPSGSSGSSAPQAQTSPTPAPTIAGVVDRQISQIEKTLIPMVEAMPEDKFDFVPTNLNLKDSRDPMRSFAFEVKHIATANYAFWSPVAGEPLPANIKGPNGPEELKTKAEILKYLKDSYAVGHKAAATLTADNLMDQLQTFQGKQPRLYLATFAVAHGYDHFGQLALYLRMSGITPPQSRVQPK